jgi:hypothetical protein
MKIPQGWLFAVTRRQAPEAATARNAGTRIVISKPVMLSVAKHPVFPFAPKTSTGILHSAPPRMTRGVLTLRLARVRSLTASQFRISISCDITLTLV